MAKQTESSQSTNPKTPWDGSINTGLWVLAVLFLSTIPLAIFSLSQAILHPFPINYGEAMMIDKAFGLVLGESLYPSNLQDPPYSFMVYPPVFTVLNAFLVYFFGPVYWTGRLISVVSYFGLGACAWIIMRGLEPSKLSTKLIALGLILGNPHLFIWSSFARIDTLALFFSVLGFTLVLRYPQRLGPILLAALFATLAIYTRQSQALAGPLACCYFLFRENKKLAVTYFLSCAFLVLISFACLHLLSEGTFFDYVVGIHAGTALDYGGSVLRYLKNEAILIFLSMLSLACNWRRGAYFQSIGIFFIIALIVAIGTAGKIGSDINYFIEAVFATGLLGACLIGCCQSRAIQVVSFALFLVYGTQLVKLDYSLSTQSNYSAEEKDLSWLLSKIKHIKGPLLGDRWIGLDLLRGNRVYIEPFMYRLLVEKGKVDSSRLIEAIRSKEFAAVILEKDPVLLKQRWSDEVLAEIDSNYEKVTSVQGSFVYKRRK